MVDYSQVLQFFVYEVRGVVDLLVPDFGVVHPVDITQNFHVSLTLLCDLFIPGRHLLVSHPDIGNHMVLGTSYFSTIFREINLNRI